MKKQVFILFLCLSTLLLALPMAWINEIHYDNVGADVDEFVEVVVLNPEDYDLDDLVLYLYNGSNGKPYNQRRISGFIEADRVGAYQIYLWYQSGIQNDEEGVLLVYKDSLVDIIAYEGSFYGTSGPGEGLLFPDIGAAETANSPIGSSIYLCGFPGDPWAYTPQATPGKPNKVQNFCDSPTPVLLSNFSAVPEEKSIILRWRSESEIESASWRLYRNGSLIHNCEGAGTVYQTCDYSFQDDDVRSGESYSYILSNCEYSGHESFLDTLYIKLPEAQSSSPLFKLDSPFPNPCNPHTCIRLDIMEDLFLEAKLFDLCGRQVMELFGGNCSAGEMEILLNMQDLATGPYILLCSSGFQREYRMITLLK